MKTKINLDEIRDVITSLKRKHKCSAVDVAAEEVRMELNYKGSNSTSGPLIRSMLDEAILAEHMDYDKLSSRLKAAFMSELRRVADDTSEDLRKQLSDSARLYDELRDKFTVTNAEIAEMKLKSATDQASAAEKISDLETSLAEAKGKVSIFDEIKQDLSTQLNEIRSDLTDKRDEITTLKNELTTAKGRETQLKQKHEDATAKLSKAETDCHTYLRERDLAKGKVSPLEERMKELKTENQRLTDKCDGLDVAIKELNEKLLEAAEARADASASIEEPGKPRSMRGRKKGADKGSEGAKIGT